MKHSVESMRIYGHETTITPGQKESKHSMSNATPSRPKRRGSRIERLFTQAHTSLYRLSGGKIGGHFGKAPVLLLTTVGRKSGNQYTTPLNYLKDGDTFVVVASHGGAPTHPTWWLNLQKQPTTQIEVGRQKLTVQAIQADPTEKSRLWPLLLELYPPYADYQKKTTRDIPVVVLRPIGSTAS